MSLCVLGKGKLKVHIKCEGKTEHSWAGPTHSFLAHFKVLL